jgi:amino acid adenylation domain-containing protein
MNVIELIAKLRAHKVQPKLESGVLKLVGNTSGLPKGFLQELRDHKQQLIDFLEQATVKEELILKVDEQPFYPTTNAQKRIWVLSQFEGGSEAYNISKSFYLKGTVNKDLLEAAFQCAVDRHESLRTRFEVIDGEVVQVVLPELKFELIGADIEAGADVRKFVEEEEIRFRTLPFDLQTDTLFDVKLLQLSDEEFIMYFRMHHIISDGWSLGVLVQEVMQNYSTLAVKGDISPSPLAVQFKDYSHWLQQKLDGKYSQDAKAFWKTKNLKRVDPLNLPIDYARPQLSDFEGSMQRHELSTGFREAIEKLARTNQTTLFNLYRAALSLCMHKLCNQAEVIIGTPVAGRSHFQLNDQVGLYVNTVPLVSSIRVDRPFTEYLSGLSKDSLSVFKYQDYPLDLVIEEEEVVRDTSRNPLFDVMIVAQNTALGDGSIDLKNQHGFTLNAIEEFLGNEGAEKSDFASKFDITFSFVVEEGNCHFLDIEYKTSLFSSATIQKFYKAFEYVLKQLIDNSALQISEINVIDKEERQTLLEDFNAPISSHNEESLLELLKPQLEANKDRVALKVAEREVTYGQIDRNSTAVAADLLKFNPERVGLFLGRSEHILYATIGVWKAGKAYVPIDILYPQGRVEYIIENASLEVLVVDESSIDLVPESYAGTLVTIDEIENKNIDVALPQTTKNDTAYLIYTSGSTGRPKGVEITHRNAIAFMKWCKAEFANTPYETLYAGTSYCFDLSIFELFFPLVHGKTLRILKSGVEIPKFISKDKSVLINTVPSVVRNLLDQEFDWTNVVALNMAGEPVPKIFKTQLNYERIEVRNLYGPSEDTTYSTCYKFATDQLNFIPIGKPVGDTQVYILGENLEMLSIGVEGEICLSGESIAKGYLGMPDLTEEKFIVNPYLEGQRLYRTGDIGKWTKEGVLAFTGRVDDQVKVRGFRIELGEIQYVLDRREEIEQAVVMVVEHHGEQHVVGYYKLNSDLDENQLKEQMGRELPQYMIPSYFIELDEIPTNSNGKVDKKKLPPIDGVAQKELVLPKTQVEKTLLSVWEHVLNRTGFGITDSFFELGGHSLKAARLISEYAKLLNVQLSLEEMFLHPTIEAQAELIAQAKTSTFEEIPQVDHAESYPLSDAQYRLWVLCQFEDASATYNMPGTISLDGSYDAKIFQIAFEAAVERHEILRTVFYEDPNGELRQWVKSSDEIGFSIQSHDFRASPDPQQAAQEFIAEDSYVPFNLKDGPLLRAALLQVKDDCYLFYLNMHHIISDGWSIGVLAKDVLSFYKTLKQGRRITQAPLRVQYKDYAAWQVAQLASPEVKAGHDFWLNQLAGELPVLELPATRVRPKVRTYNGRTLSTALTAEITSKFNTLCRGSEASLFMGLLAAWNGLFYRYTNSKDIIIGSPTAGRVHPDLENQIGFYVNTVVLRNEVDPLETFSSFLARVKTSTLAAFEHEGISFHRLIDELDVTRDTSRSPVFDVLLTLQNIESAQIEGQRSSGSQQVVDRGQTMAKFDLDITMQELEGQLQLEVNYNTDVYDQMMVEHLIMHYKQLLRSLAKDPMQSLGSVGFLAEEENTLLLSHFNRTEFEIDGTNTVLDLFQDQVNENPDNVAVVFDQKSLSYRELNEQSNQLANYLIAESKLKHEDVVAIKLERCEWVIVAILGVLKAGGAYLPIDTEYPQARLDYLRDDSGYQVCIDASWLTAFIDKQSSVSVNNPNCKVAAADLAYIIYTSGTTGKPKGVMIEHASLLNLATYQAQRFGISETENVMLFSNYVFDASVEQIFISLISGASLHIPSKNCLLDTQLLKQFISVEQITHLHATPSFLELIPVEQFPNLRRVIAGGDACSVNLAADWSKYYDFYNEYGPTETTVTSLIYKYTEGNSMLIGKPLGNTEVFVLSPENALAPIGVAGELCIGGLGVARGYLGKPELTNEKFVPNPFKNGESMYRTGDYVCYQNDGNLKFIGRKDDQVKVRGYRIELGEIEHALRSITEVESAVVLAKSLVNNDKTLVAYLICEALTIDQLRSKTKELLADYMVPSHFVTLDEFPLNHNGKLDKARLPDPEELRNGSDIPVTAPRTIEEAQIVEIWKFVLNVSSVDINDDFFALGGHSLKATKLLSEYHKHFNAKIGLKDIFVNTTVASHSILISGSDNDTFVEIPKLIEAESYAISDAQRRLWVLRQFEAAAASYNMPGRLDLDDTFDIPSLCEALMTVVDRHEALRTVFRENEHGELRQWILSSEELGLDIDHVDFRSVDDSMSQADEYIASESAKAFDLENGPLVRIALIHVADQQSILFVNMHHIISDGWSVKVFSDEVLKYHEAFAKGIAPDINPLTIQYKDYAAWQLQYAETEEHENHKAYWLDQLAGELPLLELSQAHRRPTMKTYNGHNLRTVISEQTSQQLATYCQEQGASLFMGLMASLNILFHRYTNQTDIVLGTPIAGRSHADLENQIGFYINTLALRNTIEPASSFTEIMQQVKFVMLSAYEHQQFSFDRLVDQLQLKRDTSRSPVFDVLVTMQNIHENEFGAGENNELAGELIDNGPCTAKFDIDITFQEVGKHIVFDVNYNVDVYGKSVIETFMKHFIALVTALMDAPDTAIGNVSFLNPTEKKQLLEEFTATNKTYPTEETTVDLFAQQVLRTPDDIAVRFANETISYSQLDHLSNKFANHLLQEHHLKAEDLVGIKMARSQWVIVAILGVLKTGAAYVPLDTKYPQSRLEYIEQDSQYKICVDDNVIEAFVAKQEQITDVAPSIAIGRDQLAYVIYTSGSTGKPKGVMVEHGNMCELLHWSKEEFDASAFDQSLFVTSICFDLSIFDMFYPLITGKEIHVLQDGLEVAAHLESDQRYLLNTVPSVVGALLAQGVDLSPVKVLNMAGEPIPLSYLEQLDGVVEQVRNLYGPSEDTTYSTSTRIEDPSFLTIGSPISNTQAYILNDFDQLQPLGVIGEICLSGAGLTRGYLNRPELTSEKYVSHPFQEGERLYRTGDLGCWLSDGTIEFMGRKDDQVKIRGYRIELGEIEHALESVDAIENAVVIAHESETSGKELVAYINAMTEQNIADLRTTLKQSLPEYMIPIHFVQLDKIPTNANGKVDKKALPKPEGLGVAITTEFVAPSTDIEATLVQIWEEVLQVKEVGVKHNFFELGGHSLKATRVISRVQEEFGVKVDLTSLFIDPTIEAVAKHVSTLMWVTEAEDLNEAEYAEDELIL